MVSVEVGIFCALLANLFALPSNDARIAGGTDAEEGQFPHQISFRVRRNNLHICGGSIIARKWVIIAAYCVSELYYLEEYSVWAGTNSLLYGGDCFQLAKIIIHENYNVTLMRNDIALLELEQSLNFSDTIKSINLARDEVPTNANIIISGWGAVYSGGENSEYLQYNDNMKKSSTEDCQALLGSVYYDGLICSASEKGNGLCFGDSGGPAMYGAELVGVSSYTKIYMECGIKVPDVYTKISYFRDWINEKTGLDL